MKRQEMQSMHHLFTGVERKEIETTDRLYTIFLNTRNKEDVIQIPDEYIVNNPSYLSGFRSYWGTVSDHEYGLCYHGFTIIPSESLATFKQIINDDPNVLQLMPLLKLCTKCIENNLLILHWGI